MLRRAIPLPAEAGSPLAPFSVEGSIAGIAFAVGRWLWPYRRMPLEQDAGGQP